MTQTKLAQEIGVHRATVCQWELNKAMPSIEILMKISNTLNVSFAWLTDTQVDKLPVQEEILSIEKQQLFAIISEMSLKKQKSLLSFLQ